MRRCACGRFVLDDAVGAVKVFDKKRKKLLRVICAKCATSKHSKWKKQYHEQKSFIQDLDFS
jgi:hypothetical protein